MIPQSERVRSGFPVSIDQWLESFPWAPVAVIFILPFLIHLPLFLLGLSPNPLWFNSGLAIGYSSHPLPGVPYLDPHAGYTTQALGRLAALDWLRGSIPWWNPYSGVGMPLAGGPASAAFFWPFLFLLLFRNGVLCLKISLQIVSGLASYGLLRKLRLGQFAALAGAMAYSLNGTFSWFSYVLIHPIPFLPLFLYGIEIAFAEEGKNAGVFWIGLALAWSLFAGFPETAYIDGLLALLWAILRLRMSERPLVFAGRVIGGGVLGLLLAAPLLISFGDYLQNSDVFRLHFFGRVSLPFAGAATLFLPYVFGPTAVSFGNRTVARIWDNVGGYAGVSLVFLALFAIPYSRGKREKGLRILLVSWVLLCWARSFGFSPILSLMSHIPFLSQSEFYRYSPPSWELALAILAALAIDDLKNDQSNIFLPLSVSSALIFFAAALAWSWHNFGRWGGFFKSFFFLSNAWAVGELGIFTASWVFLRGEYRRIVFFCLLILESCVFFIVPQLSAVHPRRLDWPAIHFLKTHIGLSRFYTFYPIQPNYGSYFKIAELNYNGVPAPGNWDEFINKNLFPLLYKSRNAVYLPDWPPYGRSAGRDYLIKFLENYEKVGVRYVVTRPEGLSLFSSAFAIGKVTEPLALFAGQSARVVVTAPPYPGGKNQISSIGIFEGNYGNTADGKMKVRLCAQGACSSGEVSLIGSKDDSFLYVPLSPPLRVHPGVSMSLDISNEGGKTPFAIWTGSLPPGQNQVLFGPRGKISAMGARLVLRYVGRLKKIREVYSDSLVKIWELPNSRPYYSVVGGPCQLSRLRWNFAFADCAASAKLIRRELFMPGWKAQINGSPLRIGSYDEIFQSIDLKTGSNSVRWSFSPPYSGWGWVLFLLGFVGLACVAVIPRVACSKRKSP